VDRRIFGIENEYGVTCTFKGQRRLSPDEVARYLFRKVVSWGRSSNVFLRNGARLYLDVGSHPEYATPECDDVVELVTHDKAGERVLEGLLLDAEQRLHDEGIACSRTTPTRPATPTAATRTTWSGGRASSAGSPTCSSRSW
jgi:proteasome accessory factor A